MEIVQRGSDYRSAWRPLSRENDLSIIGPPSSESIETLTKINETADALNKISEIDGSGLDSSLQDQNEKMRNLLSLLKDRETAGERTCFRLPEK